MAPRKNVAQRPKRSLPLPESHGTERRSKFREDPRAESSLHHRASTPPPPPPATIPTSPPPPESPPSLALDKSSSFASRSFTTGRRIDFNFLDEEHFAIGDCLRFQGWEYLCSLNLPTYPNLVRQFYACAKITPNAFVSEVKGIKISLSVEKLGELLHAPTEGAERLPNRGLGLSLLFGRDDVLDWEEINASKLSLEHRLLHHMTARIFLPRTGRFDFLTRGDVAILYHILAKEKFNLPAVILRVMQETKTRARTALPYGMFLTLVFSDFGVNFEGETFKNLKHYDTYSAKSLTRMGYLKSDGVWIEKNEEAEIDLGETPIPQPVPAQHASTSSSSSQQIRLDEDQLADIAQRVASQLSQMISSQLSSILPPLVTAAVRDALAHQPADQSQDPTPAPDPSID